MTRLSTLLAVGLLLAVVELHRANCQIHNVSSLTGSEDGLVLATLAIDGTSGILCYLPGPNVAEAVCSALLGRSTGFRAVIGNFNGNTARAFVAALNGCPDFKAQSGTASNLNTDCNVRTESNVLDACRRAGGPRAIRCHDLELRHGSSGTEGLVMLKTNSGNWSTVCANGIGFNEAAAVCRSIGSLNPGLAMPVIGVYRPDQSKPEENVTLIEKFTCSPDALVGNCTFDAPTKITEDCLHPRNRFGVMCPSVAPTPRPMPSPTLRCFRQSASICFANQSLNSPSDVQLTGPCNAALESVGEQVCLVVDNYANCAIKTRSNSIYDEFLLEVKFKGENATNGNTNMRPPLDFQLFCTVVKQSLVTAATLRPDPVTATTFKDTFPDGVAVIEFYRELIKGIPGRPVDGNVQVGTIIYAVVILRASPQSWLVVKDCWAQDGKGTVDLIRDKCSQGSALLLPLNDTMIAVRFQAFMIPGGSGSVSFMCRAVTCRSGDPSAECSRACRSTFRRAGSSSSNSGVDQPQNHVTRPVMLTVVPEGYGKSAGKSSQPMASLLLCLFSLLVANSSRTLDK